MNKIKLTLKRVLPCLLIALTLFTISSCKPKRVSKIYPSVIPVISNPDGNFLKIGNYKISNKNVYYKLLNSYGLNELYDWIDNVILDKDASKYDDHYTEEEFQTNMEQIIYGVDENDSKKSNYPNLSDEERKEALESFEENMRSLGYFTKEEYEAYYKLEYRRMAYAIMKFAEYVKEYNENEENKDPYFTEEAMEAQYKTLHRPSYEVILLTFDSEKEAKDVMAAAGIDMTNLNSNWKINGAEATAASLKAAFEEMYKISTGNESATDIAKTYTYVELQKISSTIAAKVNDLKVAGTDAEELTKSYSHGPISFGSRYYLILKTNEFDTPADYENITDEEKAEVLHSLIENSISTSYVDRVMNELRNEISLKIFDQGLETKYVTNYNNTYANLSIAEFDEFKETTEESDKIVASFKFNGEEYKLTADQLFDTLGKKYGAIISLLLIQQYEVLTKYEEITDIYNIVTGKSGKTEDAKKKYDEYYANDVQKYKTSFEQGNYESYGYPATYGWENFIRDYLGITNEIELMTNLDSSLYNKAIDLIAEKEFWGKAQIIKDEDGNDIESVADYQVQEEMKKMLQDYFNATIIGVMAYYDADLDGVADEYIDRDVDALSADLVNKIYELANQEVEENKAITRTLESALSHVVTAYKVASPKHPIWGEFKRAGLKVSVITSTSYTSTSSINDDLKAEIKTIWDKISKFDEMTDPEDDSKVIGVKITGTNLDPGYRYEKNDEVHYLSVYERFTSNAFFTKANDDYENYSTAYRISVIRGNAPTYTNSSDKKVEITYEEYKEYLEKNASTKSGAINAFYKVAINNILSINGVANAKVLNYVLEAAEKELPTIEFNAQFKSVIEKNIKVLIEDSLVTEAE